MGLFPVDMDFSVWGGDSVNLPLWMGPPSWVGFNNPSSRQSRRLWEWFQMGYVGGMAQPRWAGSDRFMSLWVGTTLGGVWN